MPFTIISLRHDNVPLKRGWAPEDLTEIAKAIKHDLPDWISESRLVSAASLLTDVSLDDQTENKGVHMPRGRSANEYVGGRYKHPDPLYSYHHNVTDADLLEAAGLITQEKGVWVPNGVGWQTILRATPLGRRRAAHLVSGLKRTIKRKRETVVLKDADANLINYADTGWTDSQHRKMDTINGAFPEIRLGGQYVPPPFLYRSFSVDFDHGGRLYAQGGIQNLPKRVRSQLRFILKGECRETVEIDVAHMHPTLMYAVAKKAMPPGDPYEVDGYTREVGKTGWNAMVNCRSKQQALATLRNVLRMTMSEAVSFDQAMKDKHPDIAHLFYSDAGAALQKMDSDIMLEALVQLQKRIGYTPLSVHDSLIVVVEHAHIAIEELQRAGRRDGVELNIPTPAAVDPTPKPVENTPDHHTPSIGGKSLRLPPARPSKEPRKVSWGYWVRHEDCHSPGPPAPKKRSRPPTDTQTTPSGVPVWSRAASNKIAFRDRVMQALASS